MSLQKRVMKSIQNRVRRRKDGGGNTFFTETREYVSKGNKGVGGHTRENMRKMGTETGFSQEKQNLVCKGNEGVGGGGAQGKKRDTKGVRIRVSGRAGVMG